MLNDEIARDDGVRIVVPDAQLIAEDLLVQAGTPVPVVAEPAAVWERTDRPVATGVQVERRTPPATRPVSVVVGR